MKYAMTVKILLLCYLFSGCQSVNDVGYQNSGDGDQLLRYNADHDFFKLDQGQNEANLSTGALYCSERDESGNIITSPAGNTVRSTCGLTFISPHYAITAGHCVDHKSCGGENMTFKVRQFDISTLDLSTVRQASIVDNTEDSNFENWQFKKYLTSADGYNYTEYECAAAVICDDQGIKNDTTLCNDEGVKGQEDVALIHCPDRAVNAAYVTLADDIALGDEVRVHWFYELTSFPMPNVCDAPECDNINRFYNRLTMYNTAKLNNFHYWGFPESRETQLYPLVSVPWNRHIRERLKNQHGTPRHISGGYGIECTFIDRQNLPVATASGDVINHVVMTLCDYTASADIWGCHGMSGSGVFKLDATGSERLVGPIFTGAFGTLEDWAGSLCTNVSPSLDQPLMSFVLPHRVRPLVDRAWQEESLNNIFPSPNW